MTDSTPSTATLDTGKINLTGSISSVYVKTGAKKRTPPPYYTAHHCVHIPRLARYSPAKQSLKVKVETYLERITCTILNSCATSSSMTV
jgi:hypothetical protein